jgi:hypothetical protein
LICPEKGQQWPAKKRKLKKERFAMKTKPLITALVLIASSSFGELLLAWDFAGAAGNETTSNSSYNAANINVSTLSRGAGLTANGNPDRFNAYGFSTALNDSISGNDYFTFTVSAISDPFSLSSLNFNVQRSTTSGPSNWTVRTSADAYATDVASFTTLGAVNTTYALSADLSGNSALQNLATPLTVRIFGWGGSSTVGNAGFEGTGQDIQVNGTTGTPIPEPSTLALLGLGFSTLLGLRKRRQGRK